MSFLTKNKSQIYVCAFLVLVFTTLAAILVVITNQKSSSKLEEISHVGKYAHSAIASDNVKCSELGIDMLKKGGTAVDAAIAVLYCVCTYNLQSCGVGGGFFMTVYQKPRGGSQMEMKQINARETAPAASTPNMYDNASSTEGGLAVGVPGQVHGSYMAWKKFGKLPWKDLIMPTVNWLKNGFEVYKALATSIARYEKEIRNDPEFSKYLLNSDGSVKKEGDTIKLPKLADSVEQIANDPDSFYSGRFAQDIVDDISDADGIVTKEDLEKYESHMKDAYKQKIPGIGLTLNTMSPPSSGPILALMLKIVDLINMTPDQLENIKSKGNVYHILVETMKFGFAAKTHTGDDRYVDNSKLLEDISDPEYIREIVSRITLNTTHPIEYYNPANKSSPDDKGTSHFSVLAADGSAVGVTTTINKRFGSGVMGKRTGIIFNNEMNDFDLPNRPYYAANNLIEPGKRPLSSMTPSILTDHRGIVRFVTGASGGSQILSANFYALTHRLWLNYTIEKAIDMPRFHHKLVPNQLLYENTFNPWILNELRLKDHVAIDSADFSVISAIENKCNLSIDQSDLCVTSVSDWRKGGKPSGF